MKLSQPHKDERAQLTQIPRHIGIIMDGNGRWASYRGLRRTEGHRAGWQAALRCVEVALEFEIPWLSLYAFTSENWRRPRVEVDELLAIQRWNDLIVATEKLADNGIRLHLTGRPPDDHPAAQAVFSWLAGLAASSPANATVNAVVAFNYGGQNEIVDATRSILRAGLDPADIDKETLSSHMYIPAMPDIDVVVRTGGERRLSNFMLWHVSYAELVFMDTLFPDFTRGHFVSVLHEFENRSRRFGGLPEDVSSIFY